MAMSRLQTILVHAFILWIMTSTTRAVVRPTAITIEDNGYKNVLVAIHPSTKESSSLVDYIKKMFTEGSIYLYNATEKRAYFHDVTILVPNTWADNAAYQQATSELYSNADVVVRDPIVNVEHRDGKTVGNSTTEGAFTRSYGGCGQHGVRINMFTDIFGARGKYKYGPSGRLLVHNWAHFRWGVFDEFSQEGEPQFYFSPTTGQLEAVKCNINMVGRIYKKTAGGAADVCSTLDPVTGMYPDDCIFDPYTLGHRNGNISSSIMDRQKVPSIIHFCNDDRSNLKRVHNYESPSRHNRLCGSRSTWAVISQSPDFFGGLNAPRDIHDTTPKFKVVRLTSSRRMVMAIDTSGSMQDDEKLIKARQAATSFIEDGLDDGASVGVISFAKEVKVMSPLVKVDSKESRKNVTRKLPTETGGETCIGAALLKAIELFKRHDENATDAFIVLITDGQETSAPTVDDVLDKVKAAGAVVSVITFSDDEDKNLERLAQRTGGRYYFDNNMQSSTAAVDAMLDVYSLFNSGNRHLPVQIMSQATILKQGAVMQGSFLVDESLGKRTRVIFTYTDQLPTIRVTSPTDRIYCSLYPEYEHDPFLKRVKITIPFSAENGRWSYSIRNEKSYREKVSIMVLSSSVSNDRMHLRFTGSILVQNDTWPIRSRIVAEATRGERPVKNLKVVATVDRPSAEPVTLELFDQGAGADIVKDDGLYSRYFTRFTADGRYTVRIEMMTSEGDVLVTGDMDFKMASFVASAYAGSVHVTHPRLIGPHHSEVIPDVTVDEYPPMRITDLRVLHTERINGSGIVVLAWTAPGDDADIDTAESYTIVVTPRAEDQVGAQRKSLPAIPPSAVLKGSLDNPKPFGEREEMVVQMDVPKGQNVSLVFSIFAEDESGNKGELSNLVTVGFGFVPDLTTREYLSEDHSEVAKDAKEAPHSQKIVIAGFVGSVVVVLVLTVVISIIIQVVQNKKKKTKDAFEEGNKKSFVI
ncbi:calcium-activated chloride channel regulator 4A [Aplysia californica]|uniref:Calcium-activated chloride channel regulator 4A n=1 Tax=Aplysia californica TaxID=6500 RepID=A0ABM1A1A3_APLCA|nr:calcium-activated chloride channel regulator 4A [Aplysia californica]